MWTAKNRGRYDRSKLRYPSDLTDDEWTYVEPLIPPAKRGGNKRHVEVREVMNGIMYILSTGCQWRAIPKDLPPRSKLYGSLFRCQAAPWKYSYMLGGMVSLCSLAMCLRTISEYRKRSPQMRQCHWSRANMYGRHSELFGSSLGSGILTSPESDAVPRSRRLRSETPSFFEALIPKLADPDSSCVNSSGTSIAKK